MYDRTFSGALGPYFSQIKQIAAGGNGRILSGIDTRFDFPVCIKRISVANKDECRAALREIRIRRRLRHENIVGLLNAIISDGTEVSDISPANFRETSCIYFVQELLDADLRQVIESHTRLSDEYVKLFFYQLLRGLKYIHSANVLHRDLKPSNIMVNVNSLQLMIGDFGHSMVLDPEYNHGSSLTSCDTSLWYKAPQLILGTGQYSTASDMWAVGCILAEMLLGRPLFEGENDLEQLELIIHAIKVPIKDQSHIRKYLTEEVNIMYSGEPKFPLQSKFQKVDCQAFHLLEHLLSFNPDDRVTTELALSHPFLQEYACVADEPVCLKPLHLEHEVDDFLEYTLKDLIVGECVVLAEEQPRIHQQMSSYSSLTDITKELSVSPSESTSHSTEERCSLTLDLKTVGEDYHENSNESDFNRFKVLEVLKEEHGSSSDSNGLAAHEDGVSEAPLVLNHSMFSSSKWEKERQRSGHRRHHHHRRKKKLHLKSPSSDNESSLDSNSGRFHDHCNGSKEKHLPEVQVPLSEIPENHVPRLRGPDEQRCDVSPVVHPSNPQTSLDQQSTEVPNVTNSLTQAGDDKVQELISRSRQIIAEKTIDSLPAISDICECLTPAVSTSTDISNNIPPVPTVFESELFNNASTEVEKAPEKNISSSVSDLSVLSNHNSTLDLGVAEVIRRSQELLRDAYKPSVAEGRSSVADDHVQELLLRSEQLLKNKVELETSRHDLFPSEEKGSLPGNGNSQPVPSLRETTDGFQATHGLTGLNIEYSRPESPVDHYNYPPPFTERPSKSITQLPPFNHRCHSSAREKLNNPQAITSSFPCPATDNNSTSQAVHNHQLLPKESNRRMRYLSQECNKILSPKDESKPKSEDGKTPRVEKFRKNGGFSSMNDIQNFDQSLDSIDLREMKLVLDEAKKLLEKSKELSPRSENVCLDDDQSLMEVDGNAGFHRNEGGVKNGARNLEPDLDRTVEVKLKELSCFQIELDFVDEVSEQVSVSDHAVKFGLVRVKSAPPLQKQTLRLNCFTRVRGSTIDDPTAKQTENHRVFNESNFKVNHHFHDKSLDEAPVQKRTNEAVSDDNSHKHFKNSNMTSSDVHLSTATVYDTMTGVESKNHSPEDDNKHFRVNEVTTNILDLNVDKRLTTDSKYNLNLNQTECRKYSSKYEILERNKSAFSDEVVDKLCGNACRIENGTRRLNSKDTNRLQSFYATLKIKSIMRNRTRPIRDKRHDTYPF